MSAINRRAIRTPWRWRSVNGACSESTSTATAIRAASAEFWRRSMSRRQSPCAISAHISGSGPTLSARLSLFHFLLLLRCS